MISSDAKDGRPSLFDECCLVFHNQRLAWGNYVLVFAFMFAYLLQDIQMPVAGLLLLVVVVLQEVGLLGGDRNLLHGVVGVVQSQGLVRRFRRSAAQGAASTAATAQFHVLLLVVAVGKVVVIVLVGGGDGSRPGGAI